MRKIKDFEEINNLLNINISANKLYLCANDFERDFKKNYREVIKFPVAKFIYVVVFILLLAGSIFTLLLSDWLAFLVLLAAGVIFFVAFSIVFNKIDEIRDKEFSIITLIILPIITAGFFVFAYFYQDIFIFNLSKLEMFVERGLMPASDFERLSSETSYMVITASGLSVIYIVIMMIIYQREFISIFHLFNAIIGFFLFIMSINLFYNGFVNAEVIDISNGIADIWNIFILVLIYGGMIGYYIASAFGFYFINDLIEYA